MKGSLKVEEVIEALSELGGDALWTDIQNLVTKKRGDSYAGYIDWNNFNKTMFQLVQQHCSGYKKFIGPPYFNKIGKGRFSLISNSQLKEIGTSLPTDTIYPEIVSPDREYPIGAVRQVLINAYERDANAREACIQKYGVNCAVCDLNFESVYGPTGRGFIHIHHKRQLSLREAYQLNPHEDLVPVCPNCHAMLHTSVPPLDVNELRALIKN